MMDECALSIDWISLNRKLRQHGLSTLKPPTQNGPDYVEFDKDTAWIIHDNFTTLMTECDKTQQLTQQLLSTNNSLRKELKDETQACDLYTSKITELEAKLTQYPSNKHLGSALREEGDRIQASNKHIQDHCKQLAERCQSQQDQLEKLREELHRLSREDERRMLRQTKVFQELRQEGRSTSPGSDRSETPNNSIPTLNSTPLHNLPENTTIMSNRDLKTYEHQIRTARKVIESLESQNELLRLDIESRPSLKDYRHAQQKIQKLQRSLSAQRHKHPPPATSLPTHTPDKRSYSTHIDDIEYLSLSQCHTYIKMFCEDLQMYNVDDAVNKVQRLTHMAEAYPKLEKFAQDVLAITNSPGALRPSDHDLASSFPATNSQGHSRKSHAVWCDKSLSRAIPIIEHWYQELDKLQDLYACMDEVLSRRLPWLQLIRPSHLSVTALCTSVNQLTQQHQQHTAEMMGSHGVNSVSGGGTSMSGRNSKHMSKSAMCACINHFMLLFDVSNIDGVYARMSDLYTKSGENHNVLNTLRSILGLDHDARPTVIISAVQQMSDVHNTAITRQIEAMLGVQDVQSVSRKLSEHEEFFQMFESITKDLMHILEVNRLEQIVPAVRSAKMLAATQASS